MTAANTLWKKSARSSTSPANASARLKRKHCASCAIRRARAASGFSSRALFREFFQEQHGVNLKFEETPYVYYISKTSERNEAHRKTKRKSRTSRAEKTRQRQRRRKPQRHAC